MAKNEHSALYFDNIGQGDGTRTLPIQALPKSKKTRKWEIATVDALEQEGLKQLRKNIRFREYRKMMDGQFSYAAVGLEEMSLDWFDQHVRRLRSDLSIPTYLKHYDFIGIVVNALTSIYTEFDDKFVVDSRDEYSTNEYIRQKTEKLHQYARQVFNQEVNKMLMMRGIDPNRQDFQTQEEQQAYQQQLQQEVQALTPPEIERELSKNFKVLAVEWAQNTVEQDKIDYDIKDLDRENFIDYILTGRYFKHFGVGYDNYFIERWKVEEAFFSQDVDAKYPQEGEYVGRIMRMGVANILSRYGHLMTLDQQEGIANYWNQSKNYTTINGQRVETSNRPIEQTAFAQPVVTPFHNYFDHQANIKLEDALGIPLGKTTTFNDEGEEVTFDSFIPRMDEDDDYGSDYSDYLRDDIDVRKDTVRVTEVYWRSYKRLGVLIHQSEVGSIAVDLVTDDLLDDYLKDNEIKKPRNVSLQDLQLALKEERIEEYLDTITYIYCPEVWKAVKIRGNGSTVKKDLYLDVKPLEYQIKGNSEIFDVRLPVAGVITTGLAQKLIPYQQLHNICMNQITELLEKELGIFFAFDITAFPDEYKDETTEEAIYKAREVIKDTGLLALDASNSNTQNNQTPPNLFQRHEVVYATQVQYRWTLAQQYKQEALSQIGITPQILGQQNVYTTAEGVKQGAQASYTLINPIFDVMNSAKAKEIELQIAVAQYAQTNGKDSTVMYRMGDGSLRFLDILAEDGELFPLRRLGVIPQTSSKDRKIVEQLKGVIMQDNTMTKSFSDLIEVLTNPALVELKEVAENIEKKANQKIQEERQFQSEQLDKQIQANNERIDKEYNHEAFIEQMKINGNLKEAEIRAIGSMGDNENTNSALLSELQKATQDGINNDFRSQEISVKEQEIQRKKEADNQSMLARMSELQLKAQKLALEKERIQAQERISIRNKN